MAGEERDLPAYMYVRVWPGAVVPLEAAVRPPACAGEPDPRVPDEDAYGLDNVLPENPGDYGVALAFVQGSPPTCGVPEVNREPFPPGRGQAVAYVGVPACPVPSCDGLDAVADRAIYVVVRCS